MSAMKLYAHRLGRAYGPDSSARALEGALAAGVDGLETDVCLTADDELVLLHDSWLPSCTDLDGWAHERASAELVGARLRDAEGNPTDESPLFLRDLLSVVPAELMLQLEVKAHSDPGLAMRTVEALANQRDALRARSVEVLSFGSAACAHAAALGFSARLVIWADYTPGDLARWMCRHRVSGVCVEHFLLSHPLMTTLRANGLSVTTGTINEPPLLERISRFEPDAVTSDCPHLLQGVAAPAIRPDG